MVRRLSGAVECVSASRRFIRNICFMLSALVSNRNTAAAGFLAERHTHCAKRWALVKVRVIMDRPPNDLLSREREILHQLLARQTRNSEL